MLEPYGNNVPTPGASSLPQTLTRRTQRDIVRSMEAAVRGATDAEAAAMVALVGLQGADLLTHRLVEMHDRHGDIALAVAAPIVQGYGNRVRSIFEGLG